MAQFGFSPSDIIKLIEFSARVYVAFKDANDNSSSRVEALVREFSNFHHCLIQLEELMKEFGRPVPFPYADIEQTLHRCNSVLNPYKKHLVDHREFTIQKFQYTIAYIFKENELDRLRQQINSHCQALQLCLSLLQVRLQLESTKRNQPPPPHPPLRSMSIGGQMPTDLDPLSRDWLTSTRWLKAEHERLAREVEIARTEPSAASVTSSGNGELVKELTLLRRDIEAWLEVEENREKREALERGKHLSPSDAMREQVRQMPQVPSPPRSMVSDEPMSPLETDSIGLADPISTIRPSVPTPISGEHMFHDWPGLFGTPRDGRADSVATVSDVSSFWTSSPSGSADPGTAATTPGTGLLRAGTGLLGPGPVNQRLSDASVPEMTLPKSVWEWNGICKKVQVDRCTKAGSEHKECSLRWRYRQDHGLSIQSVYRDEKKDKWREWAVQHFPGTGPSRPLSTSHAENIISIEFPDDSFGKLEKGYTNVNYTFFDTASCQEFQTLLYTNNHQYDAELLFDRRVEYISSNKNKPECRQKNVQLWRRTEEQTTPQGPATVDILTLLFYTSALKGNRHWVEEPHYAFQWLADSVYKDRSRTLRLVFSKEPAKWRADKVFKVDPRRLSLLGTTSAEPANPSFESTRPPIGAGRKVNLNQYGYEKLEIKFESQKDRREFLDIWRDYCKSLGLIQT